MEKESLEKVHNKFKIVRVTWQRPEQERANLLSGPAKMQNTHSTHTHANPHNTTHRDAYKQNTTKKTHTHKKLLK